MKHDIPARLRILSPNYFNAQCEINNYYSIYNNILFINLDTRGSVPAMSSNNEISRRNFRNMKCKDIRVPKCTKKLNSDEQPGINQWTPIYKQKWKESPH